MLTESLVAKRLGQSRPDSKDALYQMLFEELAQRGLKGTLEYRNVMFRADQHAEWLAGLARLSSPIMRCLSLRKKQSARHADRSRKGGVATALVPPWSRRWAENSTALDVLPGNPISMVTSHRLHHATVGASKQGGFLESCDGEVMELGRTPGGPLNQLALTNCVCHIGGRWRLRSRG